MMAHGQAFTDEGARWRSIADELAEALEVALQSAGRCPPEAFVALRHYEKARNG